MVGLTALLNSGVVTSHAETNLGVGIYIDFGLIFAFLGFCIRKDSLGVLSMETPLS